MNYEVVELEEKKVVGLSARTSNHDANMGQLIGGLWGRFHGEGVFSSINSKVNKCAIGLYSDYETDMNGKYNITVGAEVSDTLGLISDTTIKTIPAGKYAKFIVKGHMQQACIEFWTKLWQMEIDRAYTSDFEEYQPGEDMDNSEIHMYIAIK